MFTKLELRQVEIVDARLGPRYLARGHIELRGRHGGVAGDLLNISCSGAAVRCYGAVFTGGDYTIEISGLGCYPCTVVRTFAGDCYGVKYNFSPETSRRLAKHLKELFEKPALVAC